jgi:quinol monooxygenase YgiN
MAIRHVITLQVAPSKAADFASACRVVQANSYQEEGCEQYELFQSVDDPDKLELLERWSSQELLDKHMEAEHARSASPVDDLVSGYRMSGSRPGRAARPTITTPHGRAPLRHD